MLLTKQGYDSTRERWARCVEEKRSLADQRITSSGCCETFQVCHALRKNVKPRQYSVFLI